MAVVIDLSFDTLDEMPGKLRVAACVGPVVPLQMSPKMALQLAGRLEQGGQLQAQNAALRKATDDVLAAQVEVDASSARVDEAIVALYRRLSLVALVSFCAGVVVTLWLRLAGWF